jgi:putative ABC transport system permease protein
MCALRQNRLTPCGSYVALRANSAARSDPYRTLRSLPACARQRVRSSRSWRIGLERPSNFACTEIFRGDRRLLAFGSARQKEIAIRFAVGGTRSRIVRQLLVQGLMLSLAGGALGLLTATWAAQLLVSSMATVFPIFLALDLTLDTTVLFATMMFCSLATMPFGLWPALRLSRPDLQSSLKDHAGEISGKIAGRITVRDALVAAQLALSLALLVLSGSIVRGAAAGGSANPGFNVGQLAIAQIEPKLGGYDAARGREAHRAVLEKLRSTPGIESVAEASVLPFGDYSFRPAVQHEGPSAEERGSGSSR